MKTHWLFLSMMFLTKLTYGIKITTLLKHIQTLAEEKDDSDLVYGVDKNFLLPCMGVDSRKVTVSGISGGSFMAMQLIVIASDWISGADLEIGGSFATIDNNIYSKAPGGFTGALAQNLTESDYIKIYEQTIGLTEDLSKSKKIAPLSNLVNKPVFIWSGEKDNMISPQNQ